MPPATGGLATVQPSAQQRARTGGVGTRAEAGGRHTRALSAVATTRVTTGMYVAHYPAWETTDATPPTPRVRRAWKVPRLASRVWRGATGFARTRSARPFVRFGTVVHTRLYRLTGGRAQARSYPTLLLSVAGRTTGKPRTAPLVFLRDRGDYVVCAAYSGADAHPSWWLNLRAAGTAIIEDGRTTVTASLTEVVDEDDRAWLWDKLVRMYPPLGYYETRTARALPVARLTPLPPD